MMKRMIVLISVCFLGLGCAGVSFNLDPANGNYGVTFTAEDCINTENVLGGLVYSLPWIGPRLVAQFGCAPTTTLPTSFPG